MSSGPGGQQTWSVRICEYLKFGFSYEGLLWWLWQYPGGRWAEPPIPLMEYQAPDQTSSNFTQTFLRGILTSIDSKDPVAGDLAGRHLPADRRDDQAEDHHHRHPWCHSWQGPCVRAAGGCWTTWPTWWGAGGTPAYACCYRRKTLPGRGQRTSSSTSRCSPWAGPLRSLNPPHLFVKTMWSSGQDRGWPETLTSSTTWRWVSENEGLISCWPFNSFKRILSDVN